MTKRFLTDRKEIAKKINIDGLPVVRIDISKSMAGYENSYAGDKVVVLDKNGYDNRCTVKMFSDGKNADLHYTPWAYEDISLMPENVCIKSGFGYSDVKDMYEWRKAVRIVEGEEVVVMFDAGDTCFLRVMKVGKVAKWVYPAAKLIDEE